MARPAHITDQQILGAAREVFLEKGIQATTAEVARRAGVAEGSIFKRFKTKHELFASAMDMELEDLDFLGGLEERVGQGDVKRHLYEIGMDFLSFMRRLMPLMMMSWSNPGPGGLPEILSSPNPPPLRALKRMAAYFAAEMKKGRLRTSDPEIMARALFGSLQNYVFTELLLRAQNELPLPPEMHVRGVVDLLWNGCAPAPRKKS